MKQKFLRSMPDENGNETIDERAARLEAELEAEKEKIKNQNSYITKLESEKNELAKKQTVTAQPQTKQTQAPQQTPAPSPAELYAVNQATKEQILEQEKILKTKYGEEVYEQFKDDFVAISKANMTNPFDVPKDFFSRVEAMALGRAMGDEEKRTKIAGAFIKAPDPTPVVTTTQQVVVPSPASQKIQTMNPGEKQTLGTPVPPTADANKKLSREEFLAQYNQNTRIIKTGK